MNKYKLLRLAALPVLASALFACNDMATSRPPAKQAVVQHFKQATTLEGLVTNDQGPVKSGLVIAYSEQGQELARAQLNDSARYSLDLPANTALPVLLHYLAEANAPESQHLIAAAVHSSIQKYDINPRTTKIAQQAKKLGGYTHKNMVSAAEGAGMVPADNKTTAGFRGDPTTQYGGWH